MGGEHEPVRQPGGDYCDVCAGLGFVNAWTVLPREFRCTCETLSLVHAPDCDSIPCPFDQLLEVSA